MNKKFIQIKGPFKTKENIISYIKDDYPDFRYIKKIGIQTKVSNKCNINGEIFEIGKTGILEFNDVKIISLFFLQDESEFTLVDCIIE